VVAGLSLRALGKRFGNVTAARNVDIEVDDGEFVAFLGPSGCGKSTILRLIAGLEEADSGRILIGGRDVTELPPGERRVAMVFQSYALYPHMTVEQNITFGLTGSDRAAVAEKVGAAARMLRLEDLLDRKPAELSGGQRQRVAIGRAVVREPDVFLFDEPLSNLDAALRSEMRIEIRRLRDRLGATMIYVTHDQVEAMTMADRIAVLNDGAVEQIGRPLELYRRPASLFVAGFIGSPRMNLLATEVATVKPDGVEVGLPGGASLSLPCTAVQVRQGDPAVLGVRPEHLRLDRDGDSSLDAVVRYVERLGAETVVHVEAGDGVMLAVRLPGDLDMESGKPCRIGVPAGDCHLFADNGTRIAIAG
jgi:multiple sugar transport system ATP-binding protein